MKDRFKFRIYCKSEDKMMLFNNPTLIDGDIMQGGLLFKNYDHKIKNVHEVASEDLFLMQCTGQKDKNGKLIYEGDIVNWILPRNDKDVEENYIIIWNAKYVNFTCQKSNGDIMPWTFSQPDLRAEVIGNIYETRNYWRGNEQRLKSIHSK